MSKSIFFIANFKALGPALKLLKNWVKYFSLRKKLISSSSTIIIVSPPAPYLSQMQSYIKNKRLPFFIAAQDISSQNPGNFTGEITASLLKETGVKYAIIGHSETRDMNNLTIENVTAKIKRAKEAGLNTILCVRKLDELKSLEENYDGIVAYEPKAAIGTGLAADPKEADAFCAKIKNKFPRAKILYGGSVNKSNVKSFMDKSNIDGVLVGQKSSDPEFFGDIILTLV